MGSLRDRLGKLVPGSKVSYEAPGAYHRGAQNFIKSQKKRPGTQLKAIGGNISAFGDDGKGRYRELYRYTAKGKTIKY